MQRRADACRRAARAHRCGPVRRSVPLLLCLALPLGAGSAAAVEPPSAAQRVVRDATGADVLVPVRPRRVACLAPDLAELAFVLGAGPNVVGACDGCDDPPEAAALPRLGPMTAPSVESILLLRPDLVLATADGNPIGAVLRLRSLGVPVVGLKAEPGLAGVARQIRAAGDVLGLSSAAERLATALEADVAAVRLRRAGAPRLRACILVWTDPPLAAGSDSYLTDLAEAAGADNACATGPGWPRVSREDVLLAAPEVVLLATGEPAALGAWAASLPAVRRHAVLSLPARPFLRPAAGLPGAARLLDAMLHAPSGDGP